MDVEQIKEVLNYMDNFCPSELKLKDCECEIDENGYPNCEFHCIDCWSNAIGLEAELVDKEYRKERLINEAI